MRSWWNWLPRRRAFRNTSTRRVVAWSLMRPPKNPKPGSALLMSEPDPAVDRRVVTPDG